MNLREPEGMERDRLLIPTIGQFGHLDDKALHALLRSYVYRATLEVEELHSMFDPKSSSKNGYKITNYTQLSDAASLIEATMEELSDIASDMRHLSREMEGRDRIDG